MTLLIKFRSSGIDSLKPSLGSCFRWGFFMFSCLVIFSLVQLLSCQNLLGLLFPFQRYRNDARKLYKDYGYYFLSSCISVTIISPRIKVFWKNRSYFIIILIRVLIKWECVSLTKWSEVTPTIWPFSSFSFIVFVDVIIIFIKKYKSSVGVYWKCFASSSVFAFPNAN